MFCPNCGTQNPDAAQTCSKCSFHLKGAAAPKFKGTMLMMNQPGAGAAGTAPGSPPGGPASPGSPGSPAAAQSPGASGAARPIGPGGTAVPPGAPPVPSKLKGTMVGVAPMAGGGMGMPLGGPQNRMPGGPAVAEGPAAYGPPPGSPGVNPLGGTLAADAGSLGGGYGNPPGGMHAPGGQTPYGAAPSPGAGIGAGGFAPTSPAPPLNAFGGSPQGPQPQAQAAPQQPAYGAPPPNAYGGGVPPTSYGAPPAQPGYGPPPPQPGFGPPPGYGPPPGGGYGGPQGYGAQAGYGQAPGGYAPPPAGYGQPQGYGGQPTPQQGPGAPGSYGQQPLGQGGYAAAPGGGYGQAMQSAGQYGQLGPPVAGGLASAGTRGPTRRNALMIMLLPFAVIVGGSILCTVLSILVSGIFSLLQMLFVFGGVAWFVLLTIPMINELKFVTQNPELAWWPILVPFYSMYWAWLVVPPEVAKAKQILGVQQPPRSLVLYIFLWPFALASDLNDMVR